ncbi:hypothetical protein BDR05DRAFT_961266, partial [Suillus weaverae]
MLTICVLSGHGAEREPAMQSVVWRRQDVKLLLQCLHRTSTIGWLSQLGVRLRSMLETRFLAQLRRRDLELVSLSVWIGAVMPKGVSNP